MSKFNSLQFKISMIILVPFFIMLMISGAFNILSVRNVTRKLSYRVLAESAKGEAAKVENLVQEALDSLKTFEYIVNDEVILFIHELCKYKDKVYMSDACDCAAYKLGTSHPIYNCPTPA